MSGGVYGISRHYCYQGVYNRHMLCRMEYVSHVSKLVRSRALPVSTEYPFHILLALAYVATDQTHTVLGGYIESICGLESTNNATSLSLSWS